MSGKALMANPSYILAMRVVRRRAASIVSFFVSIRWVVALGLGMGVGGACFYGLPSQVALLSMPLALFYYVWFSEVAFNLAEGLRQRGQLVDLYLISFYDPLLLGAGVVSAEKYHRARTGVAALTFAGMSLVVSGASVAGGVNEQSAVGAALLASVLVVSARAAVRRGRKSCVVSYRDIVRSFERLGQSWARSAAQSVKLAMACAAALGVCLLGVFVFGNMPAGVMLLLCVGAFFSFRRPPSPDAPTVERAREHVTDMILDSLQ